MRLTEIAVENFRGFKKREFRLHPSFNLLIGENGSGKTSVLEAAAIAIGSWLLGFRGHDSLPIRKKDVRKIITSVDGALDSELLVLPQYPVVVSATAIFASAIIPKNYLQSGTLSDGLAIAWKRTLTGEDGKTTHVNARDLKMLAQQCSQARLAGTFFTLPLIRYFGAGRLWESRRNSQGIPGKSLRKNVQLDSDILDVDDITHSDSDEIYDVDSPFYGYIFCVDKRFNPDNLIKWIAYQTLIELNERQPNHILKIVMKAIESMLPGNDTPGYSVRLRGVYLQDVQGKRTLFSSLSDGYRNVIALAADLAIKAVMLNRHLGDNVLAETPGVVLIDELDLHLHPRWQSIVIEKLRSTFPSLQFICTTHSPFLIQSLRSSKELVSLDGDWTCDPQSSGIELIAAEAMGVDADASPHYLSMLEDAKSYLQDLENISQKPEERLGNYKEKLAQRLAPYAENPAFQAVLEFQRSAKLGE